MRIPSGPAEAAILSTLLFPFLATAAGNYDCSKIVLNKKPFDLSELGGPRSALGFENQDNSLKNTTYTIDICQPLKKKKGVSKEEDCPNNTRGNLLPPVMNVFQEARALSCRNGPDSGSSMCLRTNHR